MSTVFGRGKEAAILLDLLEPEQSINSYHSVSILITTKAHISRSRSEKKTIFHFNTVMLGSIMI